jgi:hypothetical protein
MNRCESIYFTFPNEPCPRTLSSSNCEGSALSCPSRVTSLTSISASTPFIGSSHSSSGESPGLPRFDPLLFALLAVRLEVGDGCPRKNKRFERELKLRFVQPLRTPIIIERHRHTLSLWSTTKRSNLLFSEEKK